jgi:hypothetical protein
MQSKKKSHREEKDNTLAARGKPAAHGRAAADGVVNSDPAVCRLTAS